MNIFYSYFYLNWLIYNRYKQKPQHVNTYWWLPSKWVKRKSIQFKASYEKLELNFFIPMIDWASFIPLIRILYFIKTGIHLKFCKKWFFHYKTILKSNHWEKILLRMFFNNSRSQQTECHLLVLVVQIFYICTWCAKFLY